MTFRLLGGWVKADSLCCAVGSLIRSSEWKGGDFSLSSSREWNKTSLMRLKGWGWVGSFKKCEDLDLGVALLPPVRKPENPSCQTDGNQTGIQLKQTGTIARLLPRHSLSLSAAASLKPVCVFRTFSSCTPQAVGTAFGPPPSQVRPWPRTQEQDRTPTHSRKPGGRRGAGFSTEAGERSARCCERQSVTVLLLACLLLQSLCHRDSRTPSVPNKQTFRPPVQSERAKKPSQREAKKELEI